MTDNRQHAVVLFDAVCNFCDGSVNWIIRHDRRGYFRFAALQSDVGAELQQLYGLDPSMLDTLVLIEGGGVYTKSTAGLRIARRLRRPWPALNALIAVPLLRDLAYDWFAGRRYRWCGKREECIVPSSDVRERFLGNYAGHKNHRGTKTRRLDLAHQLTAPSCLSVLAVSQSLCDRNRGA